VRILQDPLLAVLVFACVSCRNGTARRGKKNAGKEKNVYIKKLSTFAIDVNRAAQNLRKWQSA
jgi:hypothetical protein